MYTEAHTHLLTPHSHSSSAPTRGGVCMCVCVSVRTVPCACAYTGISLHRQTFPLLPAEAVCSLILPCKSGIPSSFPSLGCSETFAFPPRGPSRAADLAPFPEVVQMANGIGRSSHSCSFSGHFSLHVDYSLLFVVDWAGCGWGFFGINCKRT